MREGWDAGTPYLDAVYNARAAARRAERSRGELAVMLERQREPVEGWAVELDLRVTADDDERGAGVPTAHLVCSACRQSVLCLAKDLSRGVAVWTIGQIRAAATAHYRESHTDGGGTPN